MARQNINIGTNANDGTGDPLRTAFDKINDNFVELYGATAEANDLLDDDTPQLGGNLDVNGQRIITARSNEDIVLDANGTGEVVVEGDARVKGDLYAQGRIYLGNEASDITQVTGKLEVDGLEFNGSNITGLVTNSDITITPNGTGNIVLNKATSVVSQLTVDSNIRIRDNKIEATSSNSDIEISASGSGSVALRSSLTTLGQTVTGNIEQTGDNFITGLLQVSGSAEIDNIQINGSSITNLDTNGDLTISGNGSGSVVINDADIGGGEIDGTTIGANSASTGAFTTITATTSAAIDGVTISDNKVSANASNADLELDGNGTGQTKILANATVAGTLNTADITTTGNQTISGSLTTGTLNIGDLNINADGKISTDTNGNIDLDPSGTGAINLTGPTNVTGTATVTGQLNVDNLRMDANTISSTSGGVTITAPAGQDVSIGGTGVKLTATEANFTLAEITTLRADTIQNDTSDGDISISTQGTGVIDLNTATQSTVGSAGGASALPATPTGYIKIKIAGTMRVIPFYDEA
jgi:hypothetical protein